MHINADRLIGTLFIIFSTTFYYLAEQYPSGANLFPQLLLVFLIIGGVSLIIKPQVSDNVRVLFPNRWISGASIIGVTIVYFFILKYCGFYVSTAFFTVAIGAIWNKQKLKLIVIISLAYLLFVYILFEKLLRITLPKGMLF